MGQGSRGEPPISVATMTSVLARRVLLSTPPPPPGAPPRAARREDDMSVRRDGRRGALGRFFHEGRAIGPSFVLRSAGQPGQFDRMRSTSAWVGR